ncbi:TetR family transcriptional regulator [Actinomadura opuntiae]|uniref:TetR family transcriptional regulator n=1 Tax=Actinomadura sp. OS1-43 TaxID=604315 RepID=UPI00255B2FC5|nr:TetR family transcriptional regulator [Actinomadura sp. OS1-43]MDL4820072.1 TetR family transcriptional regulator [Actinomadura sp. OS1-43]
MAYDSSATKARILAAAAAEFAEHGVAGARVDRIAAAAQANKRAIYDYFGDKKQLFAAVLERLMAELAQAVPPGEEDLPAYAERLFDYHQAHPEALRLLLWEALELGDQPVPGEEARTRHYQDKLHATQVLGAPGDARTRLFFTLGLVGWTLAMPQVRRMILGPDHTPAQLRSAVAHAVEALTQNPSPPT